MDKVKVGIVEGQQISFVAEGIAHTMKYLAEDRILDLADCGNNKTEQREISEFWSHSQPFTIEDVTIGKEFHWEQKETQVFNGSLNVIARDGRLHAINLVSVEEYLKSVISSEMSATNNLELLKTHAIISRSWVLRQMEEKSKKKTEEHSDGEDGAAATEDSCDETIIRWWDHDDHVLYDVCADDHCQRYQGITRQISPLVAQAVEETRGEVLRDKDGNICDARFSKCCGGMTETFDTCWQAISPHYLQPIADTYCNTSDERILRLVLNDYDQKTQDFYRWTVRYSQTELSELFERKTGLNVGEIQELVPLKRGASGRISLLKVIGKNRTVEIGKELFIRKALSESHLYSSAFDVIRQGDDFILKGKGWGHGVGLCQIGAACMSVEGMDYKTILAHYFKDARIGV